MGKSQPGGGKDGVTWGGRPEFDGSRWAVYTSLAGRWARRATACEAGCRVSELTKASPREYLGVPNADGYVPVLVETLRVGSVPPFDLYQRVESAYILYRKGDLSFTEDSAVRWATTAFDSSTCRRARPSPTGGTSSRTSRRSCGSRLPPRRKAEVFHASAIGLARDVLSHAVSPETLETASEIVKGSARLLMEGREGFHAFLNMVGKDANLYSHAQAINVCPYGIALAQAAGLPPDKLAELGIGLLLHDLGMIGVPEEIVNKPGSLSAAEWQLIRGHPERGIQLYAESGGRSDLAKAVILCHHERVDGNGYPRGMRGNAIPLAGRIAATVNIFDALTTTRPYRPALSTLAAVTSMKRELGGSVDQDLLDRFIHILGPA